MSLSLQVLHSQWPGEAALPQVDHICLTCPACLQVLCLQWPRGCPAAPVLLSPTRLQEAKPRAQAMDLRHVPQQISEP